MTNNNRSISSLRRFVRPGAKVERCELCNIVLPTEHLHLLHRETQQIACSCLPCSMLFPADAQRPYAVIPRTVEYWKDFELSEGQWDSLHIPIGMAFFTHNTKAERVVALYPGPAGAIESLLTLETWQALVNVNPKLNELQPDVEALLVNRIGQKRDTFRVGIDVCFKLVGLFRAHWRGLSGGMEVWTEIENFFQQLIEQSYA